MLQDFVPDWIRATEAWRWLRWLDPVWGSVWNHGFALLVEFSAWLLGRDIEAAIRKRREPMPLRQPLKQEHWSGQSRWVSSLLFAVMVAMHFLWFFGSAFRDGGYIHYRMSAVWAFLPLVTGLGTLLAHRRLTRRQTA